MQKKEDYTVLIFAILRLIISKKMFLKCNNEVIGLNRIKIGNFKLNKLKLGKWNNLNNKDVGLILDD